MRDLTFYGARLLIAVKMALLDEIAALGSGSHHLLDLCRLVRVQDKQIVLYVGSASYSVC